MNNFIIIIGSHNNEEWVDVNLFSVFNQSVKPKKVVYYNDASTDKTYEKVKDAIETYRHEDKLTFINSLQKVGKSNFFYNLETYVDIDDNDILVFLDGDDWFADKEVLSYLDNVYDQGYWMTYGGMVVWEGGEEVTFPNPQNSPFPNDVIQNRNYRKDTWRSSHLKTMKGFVWKNINKEELKSTQDGNFIVGPDDLAIMFSALELCPHDKVHRSEKTLYIYNHSKQNGNSRAFIENKEKRIDYESEIRSRDKHKELGIVSGELAGGLGNMMFEIAGVTAIAKRNHAVAVFNSNHHILPNQGRNVNNYTNNLLRRVNFSVPIGINNVVAHEKTGYQECPYVNKGYYKGHFHSYKYFKSVESEIRHLFSFLDSRKNELNNKYEDLYNKTSIHVRIGDYIKFPDFHPIQPFEYFKNAIDIIGEGKFMVFSDDISKCKEMFKNYDFEYVVNETDEDSLCLMTMCKNNIISNSSFGWWGGWLNQRVDKKVIYPKNWFGRSFGKVDMSDIIPDEWIGI